MGGAAGLVGIRAQTAGGLVFLLSTIDETNILAFAPTAGVKANSHSGRPEATIHAPLMPCLAQAMVRKPESEAAFTVP